MSSADAGLAPVVLFLVETPGQFTELERLTRLLARCRLLEQIYLVYDCGEATDDILRRIKDLNAECVNASPATVSAALRDAVKLRLGIGRLVRYARDLVHLPLLAAKFRRLLRRRRVGLVVVTEDSIGSRSRALVVAAERLDVPVLLLPFSIANPEEAAASLRQLPAHRVRGPLRQAFAMLRPQWVRKDRAGAILRLPVGKALVLELAKLAPPHPWSGNADVAMIAVESAAMFRRYIALRVPREQLVLSGSLVDDVLQEGLRNRAELRAALFRRLGLADKPLLLVALPPDQFRLGPPDDCAYSSYAELLRDWLDVLARAGNRFTVIARPHPRMTEEDLERVQRAGIAVARDDTAALVPLCDLYVASSSATIRWAIACGRPVINFDVYRYGYDDYAGLAGVLRVDQLAAFDEALVELADAQRRKSLADAQASAAADWGRLDGGSSDRIVGLCRRLLHNRRPGDCHDASPPGSVS